MTSGDEICDPFEGLAVSTEVGEQPHDQEGPRSGRASSAEEGKHAEEEEKEVIIGIWNAWIVARLGDARAGLNAETFRSEFESETPDPKDKSYRKCPKCGKWHPHEEPFERLRFTGKLHPLRLVGAFGRNYDGEVLVPTETWCGRQQALDCGLLYYPQSKRLIFSDRIHCCIGGYVSDCLAVHLDSNQKERGFRYDELCDELERLRPNEDGRKAMALRLVKSLWPNNASPFPIEGDDNGLLSFFLFLLVVIEGTRNVSTLFYTYCGLLAVANGKSWSWFFHSHPGTSSSFSCSDGNGHCIHSCCPIGFRQAKSEDSMRLFLESAGIDQSFRKALNENNVPQQIPDPATRLDDGVAIQAAAPAAAASSSSAASDPALY